MISPSIGGYQPTINPALSRPDAAVQGPAAPSVARSLTPPPADSGLARPVTALPVTTPPVTALPAPGGLPAGTVALLESLQASRRTSELFASLVNQPNNGFSTTSSLAFLLSRQPSTVGPISGLLQGLQAGQQNSALLSSLSSSGPATGPLGYLTTFTGRTTNTFGNPQRELTLAEQLIRANSKPIPSGPNSAALGAYVQELQSKLGTGTQMFGQGWPHEWFA